MPQNCTSEIGDVLRDWTWIGPFSFIRMHIMLGSFTAEHQGGCSRNLEPGGWTTQMHTSSHMTTEPPRTAWRQHAERSGRPIDTLNTTCASIEEAGFVHVHEKGYKRPIGSWAKDEDPKETGMFNYHIWSSGLYVASHQIRSPSSVAPRIASFGRNYEMGNDKLPASLSHSSHLFPHGLYMEQRFPDEESGRETRWCVFEGQKRAIHTQYPLATEHSIG
ncbi:hypothetical protein N7494_003162 [Penicillium frequentans]|uniref:Uncharacterized protein n=1 Tax=Penicillium frequentans TaxID=3151616 RepID=A0AAD6GG58_9EURO|nr:hypothetical protein N7494_003162 [Penicillium glabrum]